MYEVVEARSQREIFGEEGNSTTITQGEAIRDDRVKSMRVAELWGGADAY